MSCFLFQVTATGWNLQTVQTRFEQTEVGWKNGELEILDDQVSGRAFRKKFHLYEIKWANTLDKTFQEGIEVILMVIN